MANKDKEKHFVDLGSISQPYSATEDNFEKVIPSKIISFITKTPYFYFQCWLSMICKAITVRI